MWRSYENYAKVEDMLGRTIAFVDGLERRSESVTFHMREGDRFLFEHQQECCEDVDLEDFILTGSLEDSTIMTAYEATEDATRDNTGDAAWLVSGTWTFYRIETPKGSLFMRWLGSSNGYYSESVNVFHYESKSDD